MPSLQARVYLVQRWHGMAAQGAADWRAVVRGEWEEGAITLN